MWFVVSRKAIAQPTRNRPTTIAAAFLIAVLLCAAPGSHASLDAQENSAPFSLSAEERLHFDIEWDPPWYMFFLPRMHAGEAEVQLLGETEYRGKRARRIVFKARSSGALAKVSGMAIDDEFIFYVDPDAFCLLGASEKIHEGKKRRQIDVEYLRQTRQLHIREIDVGAVPPVVKKDEVKDGIPECVQDPFSALYSLRVLELRPGLTRKYMVGHDDRIKEIETKVDRQEQMKSGHGKIAAWRISTKSIMGGLFRIGGEFRLWLSTDPRRLPILFEFKVPLGRVIGKLRREPPR